MPPKPPTKPDRYALQCGCGHTLTLEKGETVTCPACECEHEWSALLIRVEHEPGTEHEGEA